MAKAKTGRAARNRASRRSPAGELLEMIAARERTEAEYRAPYKSAGFRLTGIVATPSPTGKTIIEGKPI